MRRDRSESDPSSQPAGVCDAGEHRGQPDPRTETVPRDDRHWWQKAVIYQIYPRSFLDTNGDGVGDLEGVRRKLDYVKWLGADAIWLSPIYPSPMRDGGYDISDYRGIAPCFGSFEEFDRLLAEAHQRDIKLVLDFVPNHTSDQHPWFQESRSARSAAKRDWYIWRDPRDGKPPNDWVSTMGGSAWEYEPATDQFYYHAFLREQPDLNWRNPAVREAMSGVMRFWLDRGVDGFRVDAITYLVEDELLREDPPLSLAGEGNPAKNGVRHVFTADRPETQGYVGLMRQVIDEYPDRVLIGEAHLPVALLMRYYGIRKPGFNLPFNFILLHTDWDARAVEAAIDQYTNLLPEGAWPNWVLGNHDEPRVATRVGRDQARVAAMLTMTLGGTPFVYNGEELGLENVPIPPDRVRDTAELRHPGQGLGRDPQRTPMPWDEGRNGGFTSGEPWLPMGKQNLDRNVERERADPCSMLTLYRRLMALRRAEPALVWGDYLPRPEQGSALAYLRVHGDSRFVVALNLGSDPVRLRAPGPARILLSTGLDREGEVCTGAIELRGAEGVVARLD